MAAEPWANLGLGTPFEAGIAHLRRKLDLPTERWDDIARSAHDRAFIVAGAARADLLADLKQAVIDAGSGGGLAGFRKDFDAIVARHGWTGWTGEGSAQGVAWRTQIIYRTNMASSHAAGRWQQLNDPAFAREMPYWRYRHADGVANPRPQHLAWDGLTLPREHPFWQTHFPPNGWNCFPAATPVRCDALLGLKTFYTGKMVELQTRGGRVLTVTANHPVLTRRGWMRAHELEEGCELLAAAGNVDAALAGIVDHEQPPAGAGDLFQALAAQGLRVVPMAADDFHGDAFRRKAEIHVAGADRVLVDVIHAAPGKPVRQRGLDGALHRPVEAAGVAVRPALAAPHVEQPVATQNAANGRLGQPEAPGDGCLTEQSAAVQRQRLALDIGVARVGRGPGWAENLARRSVALDADPAQPHRGAAVAHLYPGITQDATQRGPADPELFGKLLQVLPGQVAGDEVCLVREFDFSGHVYDFVTATGLIVAGGLIVSNCRCKVFAARAPEAGARTEPPDGWDELDPKTGAPRGIDRGFDYAPGANAATPLADMIAAKLIRLDAPIGAAMWQALAPAVAMERRLAWTTMVDRAAQTLRATGEAQLATTVAPPVVDALHDAGATLENAAVWLRDQELVHALREAKAVRGTTLPVDVWRRLPDLLDAAAAYLDDQDQALVYVIDAGGAVGKVVVRVNYNAKGQLGGERMRITSNFIRTGGIVDLPDIAGNARYKKLRV